MVRLSLGAVVAFLSFVFSTFAHSSTCALFDHFTVFRGVDLGNLPQNAERSLSSLGIGGFAQNRFAVFDLKSEATLFPIEGNIDLFLSRGQRFRGPNEKATEVLWSPHSDPFYIADGKATYNPKEAEQLFEALLKTGSQGEINFQGELVWEFLDPKKERDILEVLNLSSKRFIASFFQFLESNYEIPARSNTYLKKIIEKMTLGATQKTRRHKNRRINLDGIVIRWKEGGAGKDYHLLHVDPAVLAASVTEIGFSSELFLIDGKRVEIAVPESGDIVYTRGEYASSILRPGLHRATTSPGRRLVIIAFFSWVYE